MIAPNEYRAKKMFGLSPTFFGMLLVSLLSIAGFSVEARGRDPDDRINPYVKEDIEKRERWAQEAKERKDRGEPEERINPYVKEDKEKRERWAQEAKERKDRGEQPLRENLYFKEDREKRERWKGEREKM